jgi:hypothetical protein
VPPAAVATGEAAAPDSDPWAFEDDKHEVSAASQERKSAPIPTAGLGAVAPSAPNDGAAGPKPAASAPGSLFGAVAPVPVIQTQAESGLSRLTGLPGLVHRYQGLKYLVAGGAIVALVLAIVVITWTRDGSKPNTGRPKDNVNAQANAAFDESRAREEAERMFRATVGGKDSVAQIQPRRSGSRVPIPSKPSGPIEPGRLAQDDTTKTPEQEAAQRRFENSGASPAIPHVSTAPVRSVREVSQTQISAVVRDKNNQAALKLCYERALKLGGQVRSGRVEVTVSIGASGIVKSVQVRAPVELSAVESCIKNAVRRWAFPSNVEEYGTSFPVILQGS